MAAERGILRLMAGATRLDRVRNEYVAGNLGTTDVRLKLEENRLRRLGHVNRREEKGGDKKIHRKGR